MRKIADSIHRELKWSQPRTMKQEFELRAGDELVGTMQFRSAFGTFATGESGDGCWTFKRIGFWQQKLGVRRCGSETEVALFQNNTWTGGGTLQLETGRSFRATTNLWSTKLEFKDADDSSLVRLDYGGVFHLSAQVEIAPRAASLPELPLLVFTAWYLAVMLQLDSGMAASAGAAAAG